MTEDTPTPPPAASDAIEAMRSCPFCGGDGRVIPDPCNKYRSNVLYRPQCDRCGGGLGGFDTSVFAIAAWNKRDDRSAIAAYHAALPSESEIVKRLHDACIGHPNARIPWPHRLLHDAVAAITALEARLADAISVLNGYEQWEGALILDNDAWTAANGLPRVPQVHWDRLMELQERRNTVVHGAAHEAAEKMANG